MNILEYREQRSLSREQFGELVGVSDEAVRLWETGSRKPSPQNALLIEDATGGSISRHDLRPDVWGAAGDTPPPAELSPASQNDHDPESNGASAVTLKTRGAA